MGIGQTRCSYGSDGYNHRELLYLAPKEALRDAGIGREDITSAFAVSSDFLEGRSLSNQYALDSIGGVMKPCHQAFQAKQKAEPANLQEVAREPSSTLVSKVLDIALRQAQDEQC